MASSLLFGAGEFVEERCVVFLLPVDIAGRGVAIHASAPARQVPGRVDRIGDRPAGEVCRHDLPGRVGEGDRARGECGVDDAG